MIRPAVEAQVEPGGQQEQQGQPHQSCYPNMKPLTVPKPGELIIGIFSY